MIKIAIVGFGPRGLHALEQLLLNLSKHGFKRKFEISIFEVNTELGTSFVWNTHQPDINLANISNKHLKELNGRPKIEINNITIPNFPNYNQWNKNKNTENNIANIETFPSRNYIGKYLSERANTLISILKNAKIVTVINSCVTAINLNEDKFNVTTQNTDYFNFDEVLLTVGHQPTKIDADILEYETQLPSSTFKCFSETYPIKNIIDSHDINENHNVAIRGMGLAMLDAMRALTVARGGCFKIEDNHTLKCNFSTSYKVPQKIVLYSLDGLIMAPKPLNETIDKLFEINEKQADYFKNKTQAAANGSLSVNDNYFLKQIIADIATEVYLKIENRYAPEINDTDTIKTCIIHWLDNQKYNHELIESTDNKPELIISNFVEMACNRHAVSLDYCVGQVWKHCQPILYKTFSHAKISEEVIASVILLDETLKRYSYGPPVQSMQQLLALHKSNIVSFQFCDNPKISTEKNELIFTKQVDSTTVNVLINSVLSSPKINEVTTLVIKNLLRNDLIQPIHSKLGIHTNKDGTVISKNTSKPINISVLGRLAKGSVVGVDAILECFGSRINDWAIGVIKRISN
ncbi:hypothetical protein PW52_06390 [Tamlana sedimentorum]|uniref:FAD-dependent urate hydroxylase HpyO/Asp monooxygenase CreE-like FAD/NAD(P)-binding domain-containing protein n=1 Tax=Neotamlana sedimentorum TaxID=1435349 RepID=A0A0D7WEQ2_9FLAO|nr:FAD/NAD(P)-binding protein [Tamlana sedimentorum]KJD36222.1 hypothetical protein PW52_06390 [Tamlana sedimentorum]